MDKSPDAFRTISEVAEHLETPAHVLRFWESRFPQIRPVKRAGGRRYYRPSDVSLLTGIKRLLHDEGMTIRGVQKILREQGVRHVAGLSGDEFDDGHGADAPYIDQVEEVVVPLKADPVPFRPAPGLAEAMAKAVDQGPILAKHIAAPSTPLPMLEPAQGALLLTPAPVRVPEPVAVQDDAPPPMADEVSDDDLVAHVRASLQDEPVVADPIAPADAAPAESPADDGDFADDEFDDGPATTLAARIRSLPAGASAGAELAAAAARLQTLRDRVAEAAFSDRA